MTICTHNFHVEAAYQIKLSLFIIFNVVVMIAQLGINSITRIRAFHITATGRPHFAPLFAHNEDRKSGLFWQTFI